jgi:hypothetical protein
METTFFSLATKQTFNKALRHFYKVTEFVDDVESSKNLADLVNDQLDEKEMEEDQILPLVGTIIKDKFSYTCRSYSIPTHVNDFTKIIEETSKWTALDIVIVYYNPSGKIFLINPKKQDHWDKIRELVQDQLSVIYVRFLKEENKKIEIEAVESIQEMLSGKDVFSNKDFIDKTIVPKTVVVKREAPGAQNNINKKVTPRYAVQVSNELFHNGNVEAWKKIVESYKNKYTELEVYIFFKEEVINDINSLFKWGKVKHGDSIFFQVGGENITGVSKLQKYLFEGASKRYEQFLKIGVGKILNLF